MRVHFLFGPEDESEGDHTLPFDVPAVPQVGDWVSVARPGQSGTAGFVVRRLRWVLDYPEAGPCQPAGREAVGTTNAVTVECEFAVGPYVSEEHKQASGADAAE